MNNFLEKLLQEIKSKNILVYFRKLKEDKGCFNERETPYRDHHVISVDDKILKPRELVCILAHEYAHFLQYKKYKRSHLNYVDENYGIIGYYVHKNKDFDKKIIQRARNVYIEYEYEAEKIAYSVLKRFGADKALLEKQIRLANKYACNIKATILYRKPMYVSSRKINFKFPKRFLSKKKLLAELSYYMKKKYETL